MSESEVFRRFADLATAVFGEEPSPPWPVFGLFDGAMTCLAGLQASVLAIACDDRASEMAALRNVAVHPDRRGQGLLRTLLEHVLPWCADHAEATLLYAETPDLYTRFGFAPLRQHAFEGPPPSPRGEVTARSVDPARDAHLFERLLASRVPLSSTVAIRDDRGMTANAIARGEWNVSFDAHLDALIVWSRDIDTLELVDIVAARLPTVDQILGALGEEPPRLRTMFSPDRLGWDGEPVFDDTGLMIRGTPPPAMRRPFMLPPTSSF